MEKQTKDQPRRHYDYLGNLMEQGVPYLHRHPPNEKVDPKNLHIYYFDFTQEEVIVEDEFGVAHRRPLNDFIYNRNRDVNKLITYYFDRVTPELASQRAEVLRNAASRLEEYAKNGQGSQSSPKSTEESHEAYIKSLMGGYETPEESVRAYVNLTRDDEDIKKGPLIGVETMQTPVGEVLRREMNDEPGLEFETSEFF